MTWEPRSKTNENIEIKDEKDSITGDDGDEDEDDDGKKNKQNKNKNKKMNTFERQKNE